MKTNFGCSFVKYYINGLNMEKVYFLIVKKKKAL